MKKIKTIITSLALIFGIGAGVLVVVPEISNAACTSAETCFNDAIDKTKGDNKTELTPIIRNIINILLFLVGVAAVIMIIIGGIRYVASGGDQSQVTGAKNTILYAVVGLVVASLAFAIVNFVVDRI